MAQQCQAPIVPVVIYIPPSLYDGKLKIRDNYFGDLFIEHF